MADAGCARPTGKLLGQKENDSPSQPEDKKEEPKMTVMVGKKAPDFVSPAFIQGKIEQVKLSDYLGSWVLLCFYPGDFTFV